MAQLFVGTSGWAYPSWKPGFYPEKLAQTKFLPYYASQLNTVEVNLTFRQLLKDTTAQKWIAQTPESFRFAIKAHQVITHIKRLKNTEEFLSRFLSTIEPLARAGKIAPVLFQLPPNMKADPKLLEDFLKVIPRGVQAAFEFRNESWFVDEIFSSLKQYNRALCVAETEERVRAMVNRMHEHLSAGRDTYAYFKHEETPQGAIYAVDVLKEATKNPATG
ncbi:MAG: DUF72 domain-containing protein [Acidobacteria bacterium]|nr:MAG: DUF72 domain-containing protein [Acidobacteriota bacterium]